MDTGDDSFVDGRGVFLFPVHFAVESVFRGFVGFFHDLDAYEGLVSDAVDLDLEFGGFEGGEVGDLRFAVWDCWC